MLVPAATAFDPDGYEERCRRLLHDRELAERVIAEQLEVVERVTDPAVFWREIADFYTDWRLHSARSA